MLIKISYEASIIHNNASAVHSTMIAVCMTGLIILFANPVSNKIIMPLLL